MKNSLATERTQEREKTKRPERNSERPLISVAVARQNSNPREHR